jgi:hypothetical protein
LDKLQELIEKYLRISRPPKATLEPLLSDTEQPEITGIGNSPERDSHTDIHTPPLNPTKFQVPSDKVDDLGPIMPIYVQSSKTPTMSKKISVEVELQNAVSLSDIIYCEMFDAASRDLSTRRSQVFDSDDSSYDSERSYYDASQKALRHRSISLPTPFKPNGTHRTNSFDYNSQGYVKRLVRSNSAHSSTLHSNKNYSVRQISAQATVQYPIEKRAHLTSRRCLVNREATELSSGSHDRSIMENSAYVPELSLGLLATELELQTIRNVPLIPTDDLMILDRLGVGRISTIYRAVWMSRSKYKSPYQVALKVSSMTDHQCNLDELRREADISSQLKHFNICELHGICSTDE